MASTKCAECGDVFHHEQAKYARFKLTQHMRFKHGVIKEKKQKRKYTKRTKRTKQQQAPPQLGLSYCPCCGTPIGLIAQAMKLATKLSNGS